MSLQRKAGRPAFITVSRFPQLLHVFPLALFLYLPTFLTTSQSSPVAFLKHESPFLQCHFTLTPHFSSSLLPSFLHPTRFFLFLCFPFLSFLILLCPYLLFYPSSVYFNSFQSFSSCFSSLLFSLLFIHSFNLDVILSFLILVFLLFSFPPELALPTLFPHPFIFFFMCLSFHFCSFLSFFRPCIFFFLLCLSCFIHSFILLLFSIFSFPLSVNLLYLSCLLHSLCLISVLPFVSLAHIFISYLCWLHHSFSHGPSSLLVPVVSHLVSMCHGAVCI